MDITARVHEIGATQNVTETFKKRDLIIEYAENPQYPEFIKLEFHQDNVSKLDKISVGATVDIGFNLRGRPWTNKDGVTTYFNSLVAWKINKAQNQAATSTDPIASESAVEASSYNEDLPF